MQTRVKIMQLRPLQPAECIAMEDMVVSRRRLLVNKPYQSEGIKGINRVKKIAIN
mgnify:CR=1 FL=1